MSIVMECLSDESGPGVSASEEDAARVLGG